MTPNGTLAPWKEATCARGCREDCVSASARGRAGEGAGGVRHHCHCLHCLLWFARPASRKVSGHLGVRQAIRVL